MSRNDILTDDYVTELLVKEAKDCSIKYSAHGLEAFRQDKKPENMPKPNTNFLRHIIRDTNAHNKALLAKEAAESKARLESFNQGKVDKRPSGSSGLRDTRRRQLGDIQAILGGRKQARTSRDERKREQESKSSDRGDSRSHRLSTRDGQRDRDRRDDDKDDRRRSGEYGSSTRERRSRDDEDKSSRRRKDADSSPGAGSRRNREERRRRDRSASPQRRRRSHSPRHSRRSHRERSPINDSAETSKRVADDTGDDSDPLDDLIGPAPPPKYRGRGTAGGAMGIDYRFSKSYDPTTDVQLDDDEDNWEEAMEAFRDRQKLRQNQEARMKEAGFAVDQIAKIKGGGEKTEEDVKWSKAGEKREWDRGKSGSPVGIFGEFDDFD